AAPAGTVFDVITAPYLGRTPRALAAKLRVIQRGEGMVLAEHYTPVHGGRLTATTLETVTFDRPHPVCFRLVRGPVPYVARRVHTHTAPRRQGLGVLRRARHRLRDRRAVVGRPGRQSLGGRGTRLLCQHQSRSGTTRRAQRREPLTSAHHPVPPSLAPPSQARSRCAAIKRTRRAS